MSTRILRLLLIVGAFALASVAESEAQATCDRTVNAGQDLGVLAANCPAGTDFVVSGDYHPVSGARNLHGVPVQDGDTFTGRTTASVPRPRVVGTEGVRRIFNVKGAGNVVFRGLDWTGAKGNDLCEPGCGSGITGVADGPILIVDSRIHHNPNAGVSVTNIRVTVKNSELDNNGSPGFTLVDPCAAGQTNCKNGHGPSSAAGIKVLGGLSGNGALVLENSRVHHNLWNGIWTDEAAANATITGNTVENNGKTGMLVELTKRGLVAGNVFRENGYDPLSGTLPRAGLFVSESQNITVRDNTISYNRRVGFIAKENVRPERLYNVDFFGNRLYSNEPLQEEGCGLPDAIVDCRDNEMSG